MLIMKEAYVGPQEEAPEWEVDNKYLNTGYRINYNKVSLVFKSIFQKHNELMNIWTHLIGSMIFLGLLVYACTGFTPMAFKSETSLLKTGIDEFLVKGNEWNTRYGEEVGPVYEGIDHNSGTNQTGTGVGDKVTQIENVDTKFSDKIQNLKETQDLQNYILEFKNVLIYFKKNMDEIKNDYYRKRFGARFDMLIKTFGNLEHSKEKQKGVRRILSSVKLKIQILFSNFANSLFSLIKEAKILHQNFLKSEKFLEVYPIWIFIISAICCMGFSTIYHTFFPISKKVYHTLHKLDHAGISILNFGSSFAMFYYFFYCDTFFQTFYSIFIFINCMVVFGFSMGESVHKPKNSKWKAVMYASLGLSNLIPMIHLVVLAFLSDRNPEYLPFNSCFTLIILMGAIYLVGLTIYTTKVPERFFPNKCDIWCNSHGIWHCFVFAAAFVHYINVLTIYETRINHVCT